MTGQNHLSSLDFARGLALLLPASLSVMGILLLVPVAPQMMEAFAATPGVSFWVPMLLTLPGLCIALFSPLAGMLGDKFGRRNLLIAAMLVYAAAGVAPMMIDELFPILATRVVVGICEALIMTLSTTLIGDVFSGPARQRWLSSQTAVASVSALLFLAVGGALGRQGWQAPFIVYASALPMALAILLLIREPSSRRERAVKAERLDWSAFPRRHMLLSCGVTIVASILFYSLQINIGTVLPGFGIDDAGHIGQLSALASIGVPVGTLIFWVIVRHDVRLILAGEFALIAAAFTAIALAPHVQAFIAMAFVAQVAAGMLLPTLLTWTMSRLDFSVRGRGMGIWQSCFALGQFLSALVVPAIASVTGTTIDAFPWLGTAAFGVSVLAAGWLWKTPTAVGSGGRHTIS